MRLVDSRLARTLEDLSDFDFVIEYTPGKENLVADALSRLPSSVTPEHFADGCVGRLPVGLQVLAKVDGGGDAMLESLVLSLAQVAEHHEIPVQNDFSLSELRELLVGALMKNSDRYGLTGPQFSVKSLRLMKYPGQVLIQEMFLVFADYFRVTVCVHYGGDKPIVFKTDLSTDIRVHVQCLGGIHFNPVKETRLYVHTNYVLAVCDVPVTLMPSEGNESDESCDLEEGVDLAPGDLIENPSLTCQHVRCNSAMLPVSWGDHVFCGLFDTGSQVSLMTRMVATSCQVTTDHPSVRHLQGLGAVPRTVVDTGVLSIKMPVGNCSIKVVDFPFVIVDNHILPYCLIFGANFVAQAGLEIDYSYDCSPRYQGQILTEAQIERPTVAVVSDASLIPTEQLGDCSVSVNFVTDSESASVVSPEVILQDQLDCAQIRRLKRKLLEGSDGRDLPFSLNPFRRIWRQLSLKDNLVVKKVHDSYVAVVSFQFLVMFVLNTHVDMAHIGTFKLLKLVGAYVWNPSLIKVVKDACRTCSICQKGKAASNLILPPTIKIKTAFPFDMMAADLLSLPNSQGFIGCLVVVDHYSKWLVVVPLRNKQCSTVVNALRDRVFPGLLRLPCRLLTDNGPEFTGLAMEEFLDELNIYHVRTTPYMPSSNGAVERVNRTVIGVLNKLGTAQDWVEQLPRAVLIYNNTVHRELQMSPSQFLLKKCHVSEDQLLVSPRAREYWKEGHHRYSSFRVDDVVLKKVNRIGNRTVDKFEPNYSGPYQIRKVHGNDVSYDLCDLAAPDQIIKAHHVQLKPWKEPPVYILEHMSRFPVLSSIDPESEIRSPVGIRCPYIPALPGFIALDTDSEDSESSTSYSSSSSSDSSSDSSDGENNRTGTRVRFQMPVYDGTVDDGVNVKGLNNVSPPKSILKKPSTPAVEPSEETLSPLAGNELVHSSPRDNSAPVILPTYDESWELSPIQEELFSNGKEPTDDEVMLHAEITSTSVAESVVSELAPYETSVVDDIQGLFEEVSEELEATLNSASRSVGHLQSLVGDDFLGFVPAVTPVGTGDFSGFGIPSVPPEMINFTGFTPIVTPVNHERRVSLPDIRGQLEELRQRLALSRRRHREQCVALRRRIFLGPGDLSTSSIGVPNVLSPPQTRSRGRAQDLPHVQPRILEYGGGEGNGS